MAKIDAADGATTTADVCAEVDVVDDDNGGDATALDVAAGSLIGQSRSEVVVESVAATSDGVSDDNVQPLAVHC